jgi:hypothetical protein
MDPADTIQREKSLAASHHGTPANSAKNREKSAALTRPILEKSQKTGIKNHEKYPQKSH